MKDRILTIFLIFAFVFFISAPIFCDQNVDSDSNDAVDVAYGGTNLTSFGNWKVFYSNGSGVLIPLATGADGTFFQSGGAAALPEFTIIVAGDIPDISATYAASVLDFNIALTEKYLTETEYTFNDSNADADGACAGACVPIVTARGTFFEFVDEGTDEETITGFTGFPTDVTVEFRFEDIYWTIDFSGTNLYGHNGIDWEPGAGDSMSCRSHDGTKIECIVSRPSALSVAKYYDIPLDSTPADDAWHGPTAEFLAGEALSQWELVYMTHDAGTSEIKLWDADGAAKARKPIGVVVESGGIGDTATGTVGIIGGIGRNDGWAFTNNQDEGFTIYGDDGTPGALIAEEDDPTDFLDSGDVACAVGILIDEDEILFDFGLCTSTELP